nr:MAG TPA: hypothetical protein [Microviridae sp.]
MKFIKFMLGAILVVLFIYLVTPLLLVGCSMV